MLARPLVVTPGGVSIHAPVKGATVHAAELKAAGMGFNPRSREGSDCDIITC